MARNKLFKNSVQYKIYLQGLNSKLNYIKILKERQQATGVISWILLREIIELNKFLAFYRLKLEEDWYEQL